MKLNLSRFIRGCSFLLCFACGVTNAQSLDLVFPYDGTSENFVIGRLLDSKAEVLRSERFPGGIAFYIGYQEFDPINVIAELNDLFIPLERYIARDEDLGDSFTVEIRSPSGSIVSRKTFVRDPAIISYVLPAETGWWVDFGRHQHNIGRGVAIDRVGADIGVRVLTYPTEEIVPGFFTNDPGVWLTGTGRMTRPNYYSLSMRRYQGRVCLACAFRFEGEESSAAGQLYLAFLSPTRGVIAVPGERPRLIELAGFSRPMSRLPLSLLTGRWSVLASEEAAFGGFTLDFGPAVFDPPMRPRPARWEHAIRFPFGTGRAECFPDRCTIFLSLAGFGQEFVYAEIPSEGMGNRHLYQQGPDGRWRVFATRVD
jgi:hypothetical protein